MARWSRRNKALAAAVASIALLLVVVALGSLFAAAHFRRQEQRQRELAQDLRRSLYAADMNAVQQAFQANNRGRALRLLEQQVPDARQEDLRGWEWRYAWHECRNRARQTLHSPVGSPSTLCFIGDTNKFVASGYNDRGVVIGDLDQPGVFEKLPVEDAALSCDVDEKGRLLAVCLRKPVVTIWEFGSRKLLATLPHRVGCVAAAFSPDSQLLVTASFDGVTRIWNWAEGRVAHEFHGDFSASPHCRPLGFSLDGNRLAAGTGNGTVQLIDVRDGAIKWSRRAHAEQVSALAISPDMRIVASASCYSDNFIRLWDAANGEPRGGLQGHTGWVSGLLFSRDGRRLISSCSDQTLRIWDYRKLTEMAIVRGHKSAVLCEALSRDGRTLIAGEGDHLICAWDADPKAFEEQALSAEDTQMARFSPNGKELFVIHGGVVEAYDPATHKLTARHEKLGSSHCSLAFSPDGRRLAVGDANGQITICDSVSQRVVARIRAFESPVAKLAFLPDGSTLVGTSADCHVKQWAVGKWNMTADWSLPQHVAAEHYLFPQQNLLVSQCAANPGKQLAEVYAWNLASGALVHALATEQNVVAGVALSADGAFLATGAHQGNVKIWDTRTWRLVHELRAHLDGVHGVAFSPDGRRLASGSSGQEAIKIWDTSTWHVLATLEGKGAMFGEIAFSPDGSSLIATAQPARALHLWHAPPLKAIEAAISRGPMAIR